MFDNILLQSKIHSKEQETFSSISLAKHRFHVALWHSGRNPSLHLRLCNISATSFEGAANSSCFNTCETFFFTPVTDPHDPRIRKYKIRSISFPFSLNLAAFRGFSKRSFEIIGRVASVAWFWLCSGHSGLI